MIKRDRILRPNGFLLKKALTVILIIVFFIYTNCSQHMIRTSHKRALFVCAAEYIQGSSNIPLGRGGVLVLLEKSLKYEYKDFTLNIPYQKIHDVEYSQKLKNVFRKFPKPNYGYIEKQDWGGPSFLEALLFNGSLIIVLLVVVLLLNKKSGYSYMTITYDINGQTEWSTFKIRTKDINKIMPILSKKIDVF
jgi:hypothetical protein